MNKTINLLKILPTFLKVGIVGFGGGSALIPVLHQEVVNNKQIVSEEEFDGMTAVATISPGALPVEISAGVGRKINGPLGMILCAAALALPGSLITLILSSLLYNSSDEILRQISFAAIGVLSYITSVILRFIRQSLKDGNTLANVIIMAVVFVLCCGKQVHKMFGVDTDPIFNISTVDIMFLALFAVSMLSNSRSKFKIALLLAVSAFYCLLAGKIGLFSDQPILLLLRIVIGVVIVTNLFLEFRNNNGGFKEYLINLIKELAVSVIFMVMFILPSYLICNESLAFSLNGMLSSILSFGGGDAYIAIANGLFVVGGFVAYNYFYNILVPVANATPGSILSAVLTGIGFFVGVNSTENILIGLLVALCGFVISIGMSCMTYSIFALLFDGFSELKILDNLRKIVKPIISGLLLNVILSFLLTMQQTGTTLNNSWIIAIACLLLVIMNMLLSDKLKDKSFLLIIASATISLLICNLL